MTKLNTAAQAFVLCGALTIPAVAYAQQPDQAAGKGIAGAWTLVSIYEEDEHGDDLDRWGSKPQGHLLADATGRFMLQMIGRDPIVLASAAPVASCGSAANQQSLAYSGRYSLDQGTQTIRFAIDEMITVSDKLEPAASLRVEGNRLHLTSGGYQSPTGTFYAHLIWKRAD